MENRLLYNTWKLFIAFTITHQRYCLHSQASIMIRSNLPGTCSLPNPEKVRLIYTCCSCKMDTLSVFVCTYNFVPFHIRNYPQSVNLTQLSLCFCFGTISSQFKHFETSGRLLFWKLGHVMYNFLHHNKRIPPYNGSMIVC